VRDVAAPCEVLPSTNYDTPRDEIGEIPLPLLQTGNPLRASAESISEEISAASPETFNSNLLLAPEEAVIEGAAKMSRRLVLEV